MKTVNRFGTAAVLLLLAGFTAVSAGNLSSAGEKVVKAALMGTNVRPPLPYGIRSAALAKVKNDSVVLLRADMFMEILGTEYPMSHDSCTYDARGRIREVNSYQTTASGTDSLTTQTIYKFDDAGNTMEMTMCGLMQLDSNTVSDSIRTTGTVYPGYGQFFNNPAVPVGGASSLLRVPEYDSSILVTLTHDPVSGKWDTAMTGVVRCLHENGVLVQMSEQIVAKSTSGQKVEIGMVYECKASPDDLTDTLTFIMSSVDGDLSISPFTMYLETGLQPMRYISYYDAQHRMVSQSLERQDSVTGAWGYFSNNVQ